MSPNGRCPQRRRLAGWVATLTTVVLACTACTGETATAPSASTPTVATDGTHARAAPHLGRQPLVAALHRLDRTFAARDRAGFLAVWADRSQARGRVVYHNLVHLGVRDLHITLLRASRRTDHGASTGQQWRAQVRVRWRLDGVDGDRAHTRLRLTLARHGGEVSVVTLRRAPGHHAPVWTLDRLHVLRSPRTLVAGTASPQRMRTVASEARTAVADVARVLPRWHQRLLVYVPEGAGAFRRLVAAAPGDYAGIAAVTTTIDGSARAGVASAVVVHPGVFGGLSPTGTRVVLAHEATHAATHVAASDVALWVAEGFADYVALSAADVPTSVAAAAAIRAVRRDGTPRRLPPDAGFAAGTPRLEAHYEEAWLAVRLLAHTYGQRSLVRFYRRVVEHPHQIQTAFADVLGTTKEDFTRAWRRELAAVAGVDPSEAPSEAGR